MAIKKSLMIAGAVASIGLAGATAGVNAVNAETATGSDGLVDKIAQKFNLDKNEVQKVFEEEHKERKAEHKAKLEEKLSAAVSEGKLTEDQKSKILAKMQELEQNRPDKAEMQNKTPEERRTLMEQHHADIEKWAEDNGIPKEYMPFKVMIHRGGPGPGGERGLVEVRED